jgi:hypothetical protein
VACVIVMPSFVSSPWIRGAPQSGFSGHILRTRARTSAARRGGLACAS